MKTACRIGIAIAGALLCFAGYAQEELSSDDLVVERELKRSALNTAFGFGSLWIAAGFNVLRVDASTGEIVEINLNGASQKQRRVAIGEGAVWVPDVGSDGVFKINPETNSVVMKIDVDMLSTQGTIGVGEGSIWVVTADGFEKTIARFDAGTGERQATTDLPNAGIAVAVDFGAVWVTSNIGDELYRIDPETNSIAATQPIGDGPMFVTTGEGSVWVHIQSDASIVRVDGQTGNIVATVATGLPAGAADIEVGGGYVWMNTPYSVALAQIDPSSNSLVRRFSGPQGADSLEYGDGAVWIGGRSLRRVTPPQ